MRKTLITLFLAAALPAAAIAAPGGAHDGHHGQRAHSAHAFNELNLSEEQKQQIRAIKAAPGKSPQEITKRYLDKLPAADQKAMQDEIKASREDKQKAIRAILTPEQRSALDEQAKKRAERRAEHQEFLKWKAEQKK